MVADAIRDCSHRKGIVLDAFVGSGTTLIAAEKTGRRGFGIEIDPAHSVLEVTGQRFEEVEAARAAEASCGCILVDLPRRLGISEDGR
jgi:DNA modification methylase